MKRADISKLIPDATDEIINGLMDLNGADINEAKRGADDLRRQLSQANQKIEALEQAARDMITKEMLDAEKVRADGLAEELQKMKDADNLRLLRETVSKDTGVPAHLLTGDTAEILRTQAKSLLEFKNEKPYPYLRDSGETGGAARGDSPREAFKTWAAENL